MAPASCAKRAVELVVRAPFNLTAKILQAVLPLAGQVASRSWAQAGRVERELDRKSVV